MISGFFRQITIFIKQNTLITAFITMHIFFAVFLGRLFALAPDEVGYLFTFNSVYQWPIYPWAQSGSGWITAPTVFLWLAYLPAKILNVVGIPDYLAVRILSILLATVSLYLLKEILERKSTNGKVLHSHILQSFLSPHSFCGHQLDYVSLLLLLKLRFSLQA